MSSGREIVIKFKSLIQNGIFFLKYLQPKFLMHYYSTFNDCNMHFDGEQGEISTPTFQNSHFSQLRCIYTIKVPRGRRITVELMEGKSITYPCDNQHIVVLNNYMRTEKLQAYIGCITCITYMYRAIMCLDWVMKPPSLNYLYESTSNEMTIDYEYSGGIQQGFRLKYSSNNPSLCGGPIDANIKGQFVLPIQNVSSYLCQWDFTNMNGTLVIAANYKVNESEVSCQSEVSQSLLATIYGNLVLKKYCLPRNTNDKFFILSPLPGTKLTVRGNSKSANYTATIDYFVNSCGGVIKGQKVTITSPNYPKSYQKNTNCVWEVNLPNEGNVNIQFNDIDLESSCDDTYVKLYDGTGPDSPILGKYCGKILPENLVASSNTIWVVFSSTNENSSKKGFNLTLELVTIGCGNDYVSEKGQLSSKNYPNLYPNNDECEWTISVWPGNRIILQFIERFFLEKSVNCTKDYVQISDYVNNNWVPLGNRLCGRQTPSTIMSTETKLKIRFRTDNDRQGDGFKATWNSLCGGIFTELSGKIISPNHPNKYPNEIKCNYTILAPGKTIRLIFKSFELEDASCKYDNLTIYNRVGSISDLEENLINTYCGTHVPQTLTILNSVMLIFMTDLSKAKKGFEIFYEVPTCGGEVLSPGVIQFSSTINYNIRYYQSNINCTWKIRAPPKLVVQLVFTKLQVYRDYKTYNGEEKYEKCPYGAVYVFEDSNITSNRNEFCGIMEEKLPDIQSKSNTLYVQFLSVLTRLNEGFVAEISFTYGISEGCGGTLRLNQTNITHTLKAPKLSVKTSLDCGWLILMESSYVAQIQVISYTEIPKCPLNTTDCRCSSIQLFDGPGRMSQKIRQFCPGNTDKTFVLSSGSEAYLQYMYFGTDVDVNFEIKITPVTSICGPRALIVSNQTKVLTSPNYPLPYENELLCTWSLEMDNFNKFLLIRFTAVDLENTQECLSNYLEVYYKKWEETYSTTFRLCHENHAFDFWSHYLIGPVTLKLHMDGRKKSKGFQLEYTSKKCQPTYNKSNGRISLAYNFHNHSIQECNFTITVLSNHTLSAFFDSKLYSKSSTLKVYDGPSDTSSLVATLSKTDHIPSPVFSKGPSLTMFWKGIDTDSIDISYTSTDQGRGCGGKMFNVEGMLTSPLYPKIYRTSATCRWDITVPRPYPITVAFIVFDLGERKTCETDYLEMYDVNQVTGKSSFIAKYCGGDKPAIHTGQTGAVIIRYVTTSYNTGTGWVLKFRIKTNQINLEE